MKNYFKALFLILFVTACAPEEVTILGTLTTKVQPANTGNVARITQSNSDVVQLVAVPFENYAFKGWLEGNQTTPSNKNETYFVKLDESNKLVTALFELQDEDGDGVADALDLCPNTPSREIADGNGCSDSQKDDDGDGVMNDIDECPYTISGHEVDNKGCADYQRDSDEDGVTDDVDDCPRTKRGESVDYDGCADYQKDTDEDGVTDDIDNCPFVANADQLDLDKDGIGDACDPDDDGDGVEDYRDNCPLTANPDQLDTNSDGVGDVCDTDDDGDGVEDDIDNCPLTVNSDQLDFDGDGIGDVCDPDDDNDGVTDNNDLCSETLVDREVDLNGCSDYQIVPTTPTNLVTSNFTDTSVDLSWTASTDNFEVIGYDVFVDGVFNQTVVGTTATITGLILPRLYNLKVIAKDLAGNVSLISNEVSVLGGGAFMLTFSTDSFGYDVNWNIKNESNAIINSGGAIYNVNGCPICDIEGWTYISGVPYASNSTFNEIVPKLAMGTYTLTMKDTFGDGNPGYQFKDADGVAIIVGAANSYSFSQSVVFSVSDSGTITVISTTSNKRARTNNNKPRVIKN